jgi:hypothetical protein
VAKPLLLLPPIVSYEQLLGSTSPLKVRVHGFSVVRSGALIGRRRDTRCNGWRGRQHR